MQKLVERKAIEFGDFTLASGRKSNYYVDIKRAITDSDILREIAEAIGNLSEFDCVAGVAVGGIPIAVAVALEKHKPFAIVRSASKSHGKSDFVIGDVNKKQVLLVEDVTTTGGSAIYGIEKLRECGAVVTSVITVIDREEGAKEALHMNGVALTALLNVSDIFNYRRKVSTKD